MVKDIPIPEEIFREFQPLVENKKSLAKLFDDFDFVDLCNNRNIGKEMPSHNKGQNCLDKYFAKVNLKDSENRVEEMGKKNTKFNTVHEISNSSGSETEITSTLKTIPQTNPVYEPKDLDDLNCKENREFERLPSKPIIAAMNALGKLKRGISELNVDDNSSRDSTALVIDEEQLESEKDVTTISPEEAFQIKQLSKKSLNNNDLSPLKDTASLSGKPTLSGSNKNETLTISQFFNTTKTTSTPVDGSKGTKRKRSGSSSEHPHSKKSKEKNLSQDSECCSETFNENMENLTEVKPLRDGSCPLILEDLDSEDEIYVVQCPKEVELESLVGKQIELNGEFILKLQANGEVRPFDCFSQKDSMERHVNIILPSKDEGAFKFGVYQLNGSIVISESLDAPHIIISDDEERPKEVTSEDSENKLTEQPNELQATDSQKRKKHKKRNTQIADDMEEGNIPSPKGESPDENNMSSTIKKKKKKKDKIEGKMHDQEENLDFGKSSKKIKKKEEEGKMHDQEENLDFGKSSKKIKKKEEEELPFVHQQEEFTSDEKPIKKKKKKKHLDEPELVEKEIEMDHKIPLENMKEELLAVQEDNPTKKKKKKKYKEREDESEHISMEPVLPESIVTDDQLVKKKKKKKYLEQEFEPSIEIEDDTSPRKKHKHQAEDSTDVYVRTGEVDVDTSSHLKLSTFIETDAQSIKKKKKKKKKKERDVSPN